MFRVLKSWNGWAKSMKQTSTSLPSNYLLIVWVLSILDFVAIHFYFSIYSCYYIPSKVNLKSGSNMFTCVVVYICPAFVLTCGIYVQIHKQKLQLDLWVEGDQSHCIKKLRLTINVWVWIWAWVWVMVKIIFLEGKKHHFDTIADEKIIKSKKFRIMHPSFQISKLMILTHN